MFMVGTYTEHFIFSVSEGQVFSSWAQIADKSFFLGVFAYLLGVSYMLIISSFTVFHYCYLVWGNKTTLEYCETEEKTEYHDNGPWKNWKDVFGGNPLLWFIPFSKLSWL